jgi:hypothetical protein
MSIDAFNRETIRELILWSPFLYSFPFDEDQTADRIVIYGLYSSVYVDGQQYLTEVETVDLENMLNDYNTKMAELSTEQQVTVADIVSKRYLATIEKAIHDQKMVTKGIEIQTEDDLMTAKIAALAADQAALDTLNEKVLIETVKTQNKILELQAYIMTEGYNLSEVDVEIAEKNIQAAEVDIKILNAINEILKIQIDTVEAGVRLVDVDVQRARTLQEIANTNKNIADIGLLANDLVVAEAQTAIAEAELPIAAARVSLAQEKSLEVDRELTFAEATQPAQADTDYQNKLAEINLKHTMKETALSQEQRSKEQSINYRLAEGQQAIALAGLDSFNQVAIDKLKVQVMTESVSDLEDKVNAAIAAEQVLVTANVSTSLVHTIGKAAS